MRLRTIYILALIGLITIIITLLWVVTSFLQATSTMFEDKYDSFCMTNGYEQSLFHNSTQVECVLVTGDSKNRIAHIDKFYIREVGNLSKIEVLR